MKTAISSLLLSLMLTQAAQAGAPLVTKSQPEAVKPVDQPVKEQKAVKTTLGPRGRHVVIDK